MCPSQTTQMLSTTGSALNPRCPRARARDAGIALPHNLSTSSPAVALVATRTRSARGGAHAKWVRIEAARDHKRLCLDPPPGAERQLWRALPAAVGRWLGLAGVWGLRAALRSDGGGELPPFLHHPKPQHWLRVSSANNALHLSLQRREPLQGQRGSLARPLRLTRRQRASLAVARPPSAHCGVFLKRVREGSG